MRCTRLLTLSFVLPIVAIGGHVHAKDRNAKPVIKTGDISYSVRKGDNLFHLAQKYMRRTGDYKIVQRLNRISRPRQIPVGTKLKIPFRLLKYKASLATLSAYRGAVSIAHDGSQIPAKAGLRLKEGTRIGTSTSSFVTLELEDGSLVSIPSKSGLRINRLRKILLTDSIDYEFGVEKGSARTKVSPLRHKKGRFHMRTPIAVSAVRGTDFRTRWNDGSGDSISEVVEGHVSLRGAKAAEAEVMAGHGAAVGKEGIVKTSELLPAIKFSKIGRVQSEERLSFDVVPSTDATSYRVQIAGDAGFIDRIYDTASATQNFEFGSLPNGNYFIKGTAISADGFEGIPGIYSFKRRLNTLSGSAEQGDDGYKFRWTGTGDGVRRYRFQLFRGDSTGVAMVDKPGLESKFISLSDLPPGEYQWRVGVTQYQDGEADQKWTAFDKLTISAPE